MYFNTKNYLKNNCNHAVVEAKALYKIVCLEAMQPFDPGECSV